MTNPDLAALADELERLEKAARAAEVNVKHLRAAGVETATPHVIIDASLALELVSAARELGRVRAGVASMLRAGLTLDQALSSVMQLAGDAAMYGSQALTPADTELTAAREAEAKMRAALQRMLDPVSEQIPLWRWNHVIRAALAAHQPKSNEGESDAEATCADGPGVPAVDGGVVRGVDGDGGAGVTQLIRPHPAPTGEPEASDARCSICRGGGLIGKDGYFATCVACGGFGRPIDPRPLCVSCSKPWVPPEGVDATAEECGPCRYRRHGRPVPPETSCRVCEYHGYCVKHPLAQPAAAQGERKCDVCGGDLSLDADRTTCCTCEKPPAKAAAQGEPTRGNQNIAIDAYMADVTDPLPIKQSDQAPLDLHLRARKLQEDIRNLDSRQVHDVIESALMREHKLCGAKPPAKERGEAGEGVPGVGDWLASQRMVRELQSTLAERDREVERLKGERDVANSAARLQKHGNDELAKAIDVLQLEVATWEGAAENLEDVAKRRVVEAEQRVRGLEVERDILQSEREDEHRQRIHWQQRADKAEAERDKREAQLKAEVNLTKELRYELGQAEEALAESKADLERANARHDDYESRLQAEKERVGYLEGEAAELRARVEAAGAIYAQNKELMAEVTRLREVVNRVQQYANTGATQHQLLVALGVLVSLNPSEPTAASKPQL